MKIQRLLIIAALFMVDVCTFAQTSSPTFIHREIVFRHYRLMESGLGEGLKAEDTYYGVFHHGFTTSKCRSLSKFAPREVNQLETSQQVAYADSIDSVARRRALVEQEKNILDKSSTVGTFFSVERARLDQKLNQWSDNIDLIQTPRFGGSGEVWKQWNMKREAVKQAIGIVESYRMKAVDRKKCYIDLYNDVLKYNYELCGLLMYLEAGKSLEEYANLRKPVKIEKKNYAIYALGRWKLAMASIQ